MSKKILIADRAFVGDVWFKFLTDNKIDFVIRLSRTCYKNPITKSWGKSHAYLEQKAKKRKSPVGKIFQLNGEKYMFIAVKNTKIEENEAVIFLISSLNDFNQIAKTYKIRWEIETWRFAAAI